MPNTEADIGILESLQEALLTFAARQTATMKETETLISNTQVLLERVRYHGERESRDLEKSFNACLSHAVYAASMGYYVRCSHHERAWREAEQRLKQIIQWQTQVEQQVAQYDEAACCLLPLVEDELPRARAFLADRVLALQPLCKEEGHRMPDHTYMSQPIHLIHWTNGERLSVKDQSRLAWQKLELEWKEARQHWNDSYATIFADAFWHPLATETEAYLVRISSLSKMLGCVKHWVRSVGISLSKNEGCSS